MAGWSTPERGAFFVLALACAGLSAVAYHELASPLLVPIASRTSVQMTSTEPAYQAANGQNLIPPLKSFAEVIDRPLFSPDRRPPREAARSTTKPWSALVLKGIIVTRNVREALMLHRTSPTVITLKEGQTIDGWTIRRIGTDRVVIESDGVRHQLTLPGTGSAGPRSGIRTSPLKGKP